MSTTQAPEASALITIQINRCYTGAVLYEHQTTPERQASGLALRDAVEKATASGANLSRAYLSGADLSGAYLSGAKMHGHEVVGQRPCMQIGPIGSRCALLTQWLTKDGAYIQAGCFFGTRDEFEAAVNKAHGTKLHGEEYRAALVLLDAHAKLWTPAVEAVKEAA